MAEKTDGTIKSAFFCLICKKNGIMRIYLVGYMYSGKSTVGRRLAKMLSLEYIDLDALFEQRYKISVYDFFARYDEAAFRTLEHETLLTTANCDNCVISTGGGTPCFLGNMDFIKAHGTSIYLKASVGTIVNRHANSKKRRPLLAGLSPDELREFVVRQLSERSPFYCLADYCFDAENISVKEICQAMGRF